MKFPSLPLSIQATLDYNTLPPKRKAVLLAIYQNLVDFIDLGLATDFGTTGEHTHASKKTLYRYTSEGFDILFYLTPQTKTPSIETIFYKEGQLFPNVTIQNR